ncbi:MAG: hypothetical protein ABEH35_00815 [Haloarculaceae archaeon]
MDFTPPKDLERWLENRAEELGIEQETLLVQLIDTYRTQDNLNRDFEEDQSSGDILPPEVQRAVLESILQEKFDDDQGPSETRDAGPDETDEGEHGDRLDETVEKKVQAALDDQLEDRVQAALDDRLDDEVDRRIEEGLDSEIESAIENSGTVADLEEDLESLRADYEQNLQDVRERVIQVKKDADEKAPADRQRELEERVESLETELEEIGQRVSALSEEVESDGEEIETLEESLRSVESEFDSVKDRLQRVAWVVNGLKDRSESRDEVHRLKARAAELDVSTAECERCGETVEIDLLTEPECPHCNTAVDTITDTSGLLGLFDSPQLLTKSSSETSEESDTPIVPDEELDRQ